MNRLRRSIVASCLSLLLGLAALPAALAQSQQQRCDDYSAKVGALCELLPKVSCPWSEGHPCYRSVNTESQYRLACMSGRFGNAQYQQDLLKAQSLIDQCQPGTTPPPPPPPTPSGRPCPAELANVYRNLLDEAAELRQQVAYEQDPTLRPTADFNRAANSQLGALLAEASAATSVAKEAARAEFAALVLAMDKALGQLREAQQGLPGNAAHRLAVLEEKQRIVANQISLIRDRADSQRCVLPPVAPIAPTAAAPRLLGATRTVSVLGNPAPAVSQARELTSILFLIDTEQESRSLRETLGIGGGQVQQKSGVTIVGTAAGSAGTRISTPEGMVRSERTLYIVARDPGRALTFVHVSRGAVTATPLRGAALQLSAGQSAIVSATSARLVGATVATPAGMEPDTDRNGSDYTNFEPSAADPRQCMDRCRGDPNCRAWTYVKPGVHGPNARCFLKNPAPPSTPNACCISGAVTPPAEAQAGFEVNFNRHGSDYTSFNLPQAVPDLCAARCSADARCAAWTFVRPGVQGPSARCYLKDPAPPATPNTCCVSGLRMDMDTDRSGSDYAHFNLPSANPLLCQQRCENDGNCRAWSYVKPGQRGPSASCYLKNPAPEPTRNACCISGVVKRSAEVQGFELNTDRHGSDIARFELPQAVPDQCFERCRADSRCAAWTFVRPGVQGPNAVCYLKSPAPPPTANNCCISGAIAGRGTVAPPPPPPPPPSPPPGVGGDFMVATTVAQVRPGARFDANFRRPASEAQMLRAWIGIAPVGSPRGTYLGNPHYSAYLDTEVSGVRAMTAPYTAGSYELRLYGDVTTDRLVATAPLTVLASAPSVVIPPVVTPPPPPPPPPTGGAANLGTVWIENEGSETAVWTRRAGTNTFDASWSNGRVRAVLEIALQGNQVTVRRTQSTDGYECLYTGTLNGNQVSGTFGCNRFAGQIPWRATIQGGGGVTSPPAPTTPPPPPPPPVVPPTVTPPTAIGQPRYLGCFRDPNSPFDLDGHLERSAQNTPERCVQTCAARGFRYAGVQYAESCLCGNSYGRFGAAQNCNMACTGNPRQVCGGGNANSVYETGVAPTAPTTPTPRPPPTTTAPPPPPPPPPGGAGRTRRRPTPTRRTRS